MRIIRKVIKLRTKVIKCVIFILLLMFFLILLSKLFYPKNNNVDAGIHSRGASGILAEPRDSIDVIFYGNSEAYTSIIPLELWNDYGYTSYVCASPEQKLPQSVRFIFENHKNQHPKIIVLEANNIFSTSKLSDASDQFLNCKLKVFQYHDRWKSLKKDDLSLKTNFNTINYMKGYEYSDDIAGVYEENTENETGETGIISKSNSMYINIINNFCKENGIKFIILSSPSIKYWNHSTHDSIQSFCDKNGIEYVDLNLSDEVNVDWTKDTRDYGDHLNHTGALKVTKYVGKYLHEKNILKNHKDDDRYKQWDDSYEQYKRKVND